MHVTCARFRIGLSPEAVEKDLFYVHPKEKVNK